MTALIPDDYISDTELRLNIYRQIASITELDEIAPLEDELRDRFGDFPVEVEHLFSLIGVRIRAAALGIDSVVERDREIVIRPVQTDLMNRNLLVRRLEDAVRITPNSIRIRLLDLTVSWQDALDTVLGEAERVHAQATLASVA
jgi:transcription-repair coupling factor (superfamily II helicase)